LHEKVLFPIINAAVEVVAVKPGVVRLGIEAPPEVIVLREELQELSAEGRAAGKPFAEHAIQSQFGEPNHLLRNRLNVASIGFALFSRQLQAGRLQDAEATLVKISKEFQLFQRQLEGEEKKSYLPRQTKPCKAKALLVEDNPNERELLAVILRMAGVDVDTVGDGTDALDYLHTHDRPDVMLLDMGLPRCDGATAVREIRRDPAYAGLRIFAVTGHPEEEFDLVRGPGGVDRWFRKPVDPASLIGDLNHELADSLSRF